jgi:hypothetical protein
MSKATGIAQFAEGRSDVFKVDPRKLIINEGWNGRDESPELNAHIDQLALSISKIGVKKPLEVKLEDGKLVVKDGHCRLRAVMLAIKNGADIKTVPVMTVDRYASDEDLILNQVISNTGKPLTTMEQAKVFKKLLDLLTMPASVQSAVSSGAVSASLAAATVRNAETPQQGAEALQAAVNAAAAEGRKKVKPQDVPQSNGQPRHTLKECFDNSEIDSENSNETGYVDIRMPLEEFEFIRDLLKL